MFHSWILNAWNVHAYVKYASISNMQCIDPYVLDTLSGECSLDTDGDAIPDYRASTISYFRILFLT